MTPTSLAMMVIGWIFGWVMAWWLRGAHRDTRLFWVTGLVAAGVAAGTLFWIASSG